MGKERREKIDMESLCSSAKGSRRALPGQQQGRSRGGTGLGWLGLSPGGSGAWGAPGGSGEHLEQLGTFGSFTWKKKKK